MLVPPIYSVKEAQLTILKRTLIQEPKLSTRAQQKINEVFGEHLTALQAVQKILQSVREGGDKACIHWTKLIDGTNIESSFEISKDQMEQAIRKVNSKLIQALRVARDRILHFHKRQPVTSWFTTELGGQLGQLIRPIEKVGFYVPGGSAPLPSSVLMSVCPAVAAGCETFIVMSPPSKDGKIADVTLAACGLLLELGINLRVFSLGGSQAIGALAFGTETVPQVDKIVGPGNIFVSLAKKEVFGIVGIDGVYGPTEAVIIADETADPELVASDLLAQAEHDEMAIPILITCSSELGNRVARAITNQLEKLSRATIAAQALQHNGGIIVASTLEECFQCSNQFSAEHVSLAVKHPWEHLDKIRNGGGVFIGESSCEVLGDYVAGPSHVMPTSGSARFSSPLNVLDFVKIVSVVGLDRKSASLLAEQAEIIANSEGLTGHAEAAKRRLGLFP
eukprot:jgi/Galph1/698/GphlegSOOS_G5448.1